MKEDAGWYGRINFAGKSFYFVYLIRYTYVVCLINVMWFVFDVYGLIVFLVY